MASSFGSMPEREMPPQQMPDIEMKVIDAEDIELSPERETEIEQLAAKLKRDPFVMKMQEREKIARERMAEIALRQQKLN